MRLLLAVLTVLVFAFAHAQTVPELPGKPLREGVGLYPRVLELTHSGPRNGRILASVVTFEGSDGLSAIYESTDGGASFTQVGTVADPDAAGGKGLCCATLYEVPQTLGGQGGGLQAGTLLWAASVGQDGGTERRMALRVWQSGDAGRSWTYRSSCAVAPNAGGLWEPEFSVDRRGRLVCSFADETDGERHSQFLARTVSRDGGRTWGPKRATVALPNPAHRPGMPVVRTLANGTYLLSYEICALPGQLDCAVFLRRSADGVNWGDPRAFGQRIVSNTGRAFAHTPVIAPTPDGRLLLNGQLLQNPDGGLAGGNGGTLMVNFRGGAGAWYEFPAPVAVPDAFNDYCPNYSSPLLPLTGGRRVFGLATDYFGGFCRAFYGSAPVPDTVTIDDSTVDDGTVGGGEGQFRYSALWGYGNGCGVGCFGGGDHFTDVDGSTARLRFYGSRVVLYGARDPGHGVAEVSIDKVSVNGESVGGKAVRIDLYAPRREDGAALYRSPRLPRGLYTLTVRVTGERHPAAENGFVAIDRADVTY